MLPFLDTSFTRHFSKSCPALNSCTLHSCTLNTGMQFSHSYYFITRVLVPPVSVALYLHSRLRVLRLACVIHWLRVVCGVHIQSPQRSGHSPGELRCSSSYTSFLSIHKNVNRAFISISVFPACSYKSFVIQFQSCCLIFSSML